MQMIKKKKRDKTEEKKKRYIESLNQINYRNNWDKTLEMLCFNFSFSLAALDLSRLSIPNN